MSCLMLLASLERLLPARSLLRVGRLFLGATALHASVVRGQETTDRFGRTTLGGVLGPVDTTGNELCHRLTLRQARGGGRLDRCLGGRPGSLPALVRGSLPGVGGHPGAVR